MLSNSSLLQVKSKVGIDYKLNQFVTWDSNYLKLLNDLNGCKFLWTLKFYTEIVFPNTRNNGVDFI